MLGGGKVEGGERVIKASEIADAISAIDAAISFVTASEPGTPRRVDVREKLIKSRVDLEFGLREIKLTVEADK